jgi:hypothetical protein
VVLEPFWGTGRFSAQPEGLRRLRFTHLRRTNSAAAQL